MGLELADFGFMLFLVDRVLGGGDTPGKFVRVSKERSYVEKCLYVCEKKGGIGTRSARVRIEGLSARRSSKENGRVKDIRSRRMRDEVRASQYILP